MMLNYIGYAFGLLPVIAAIFNYKNLISTLKIAAVFFLLSFIIDSLLWLTYLKYIDMIYNHPLLYASIFLNILFYTYLYYKSFYSNQAKKFTLYFGVTAALFLIVFVLINGVQKYPNWANTMLGIYMIVVSLLFFYQLFNRQEFIAIEKQALFWISSGALIYFSITIFLFLLAEKIAFKEFLIINAIANIISNSLFTIGLSCKPQKSVSHLY